MAVFKPKIKETTEDRLQKAINLGREEALKEVLEWLEKEMIIDGRELIFQSFKERFNMVDNCDQQYPSDFIND